jgi:hypothetical protein
MFLHMSHGLDAIFKEQAGVISRSQVLETDHDDNFIEVMLRRNEWRRVHRGVYVNHTGDLTWLQRAWGAVLFYAPAALCNESALALRKRKKAGLDVVGGSRAIIHIGVAERRRVEKLPGVTIHRLRKFEELAPEVPTPRRVRVEHAVLQVAASADDLGAAVTVISDACQERITTAQRLRDLLNKQPRLHHRRQLLAILDDVASGAYSVLERNFLHHVERAHGLPTAARQRRVKVGRSAAYRDVEYVKPGLIVELDGRLGHEWTGDRWADMERDIDSTVAGSVTVRVSWGQVLEPCRLAQAIGRLLRARGWNGSIRPCGPSCTTTSTFDAGVLSAP